MLLEVNTRPAMNINNTISIDSSIFTIIPIYINLNLKVKSCENLTRFLESINIQVDLSKLPKLKEGDLSDEYELNISNIPFLNLPFTLEAIFRVNNYIKVYVEILQVPYKRFLNKILDPRDVKIVLELLVFSMYYNSSIEDLKLFVNNNIRYINRSMIMSLYPKFHRNILDNINSIEVRNIRFRHSSLLNYYDSYIINKSYKRYSIKK